MFLNSLRVATIDSNCFLVTVQFCCALFIFLEQNAIGFPHFGMWRHQFVFWTRRCEFGTEC
jgi:hypothetical protein